MSAARAYSVLPIYYDALMAHVDYDAWTSFALQCMGLPERVEEKSVTLLDLGCGTGSVAVNLARRGYRVVCVDGSEEMLAVAEQKARPVRDRVLLLHQGLTDLALDEPVDGVLCLCDTLNYVTRDGDLERTMRRVARTLRPGCPFVFDMHTEGRLREIGASKYSDETDDVMYLWTSEFDEHTKRCTMDLTLFVDRGENLYERFDETHVERAYTHDEIALAVVGAGLVLVGTYGDLRDAPPGPEDGRHFYLARKPIKN